MRCCWWSPTAWAGIAHGEVAAQIAIDVARRGVPARGAAALDDPTDFLVARDRRGARRHPARGRTSATSPTRRAPCSSPAWCRTATPTGRTSATAASILCARAASLVRTRDHTVVQQLVDSGRIREEAAGTPPGAQPPAAVPGRLSAAAARPRRARRALATRRHRCCCAPTASGGRSPSARCCTPLLTRDARAGGRRARRARRARAGPQCDNVTRAGDELGRGSSAPAKSRRSVRYYDHRRVQDLTATDPTTCACPTRTSRRRSTRSRPPCARCPRMRPSGAQAQRTSCAPVRIQRGFTRHAEGSVLVEFGDTRVLCTASVEERVPPFLKDSGRGWVTAEYGMLPRATNTRSDREAARGKQSGRTQEIQRLIGRSLRAVVDLARARASAPSSSTATCCRPTAARAPPRSPARSSRCTTRSRWLQRSKDSCRESRSRDFVAAVSVGIFERRRRCSTSTTPRTRRAAAT